MIGLTWGQNQLFLASQESVPNNSQIKGLPDRCALPETLAGLGLSEPE